MERDRYKKLAEHMDRLPGGFPPQKNETHLRLLEYLFSPEEAELAVHLTLDREKVKTIAARANLPTAECANRLEKMARNGLIFSAKDPDGSSRYQATPWVLGIYEFQLNNLTDELRRLIDEYRNSGEAQPHGQPQMRTIPVGESVKPHLEALPYDQVDALIGAHDRYAAAPCICRRQAKLHGAGCDAPEESCLTFGEFADYYVENGLGRYIDRAELSEILRRADEANLVLQPTNSQTVAAICCCCGCCCGILKSLQSQPVPAKTVASSFIAKLESEECTGCFTCMERCQMQAFSEAGDRVSLNSDRCIGCGLCVTTCPSGALALRRKPKGEQKQIPATLQDTWRTLAGTQ